MNTFIRWGKFNLVGAIGMVVQLGALAALNAVWPERYLAATAAALELTLVHNFIWHLHYTWRDRFPNLNALHRRRPPRRDSASAFRVRHPGAWRTLMGQFVRFHLSNGLVSIVGNLVLMPLLVHGAGIPVVGSNAIAILCCSLVNFCLSNNWAFAAARKVEAL